jgi:hypothetical protein
MRGGSAAGLSRPYAVLLLATGGLGALALAASAWLYARSLPEYGPSADVNDDGFITLAEAQQKLPDLPLGKPGRWTVNVNVIDTSMDKKDQQESIDSFSRIFIDAACRDSFKHLYFLDIDNNLLNEIQANKFIIDEIASKGDKAKIELTRTSSDDGKILARVAVTGQFFDESADFLLTFGGRDDSQRDNLFRPQIRMHVVAKRVGECGTEQSSVRNARRLAAAVPQTPIPH